MEDKIKELKELSLAYKAANEYDYCPSSEKAEYICENLFAADVEELKAVLDEYQGWSPGDIKEKVFIIIDGL